MALTLYAGIRVAEFATALPWYERLLGGEPSFFPHETEAVWELAKGRSVYVHEGIEPGGAEHLLFVDDLDAAVRAIAARGIEPDRRETYANGTRKLTYRDADGNEIAFGGTPAA